MSAARRGASAADALARMQRAAAAPSPATREPSVQVPAAEDTPPALPVEPEPGRAAADVAAPAPARPLDRRLRTTLDLDVARHTALRVYAARHQAKGAEVMRALLDQLEADPELARTIGARLAGDRTDLH